jgi:CHASE3 domain sensor protein
MGALSDIEQAEREAKNPPIFKKLFAGQSVEQEAIQAFARKQKAHEQREELRQWISLTLGKSKWDELIRMEADIRKQRQETLYRQRERRQKFIEITVLVVAMIIGLGFLAAVVYFGMKNRGMV